MCLWLGVMPRRKNNSLTYQEHHALGRVAPASATGSKRSEAATSKPLSVSRYLPALRASRRRTTGSGQGERLRTSCTLPLVLVDPGALRTRSRGVLHPFSTAPARCHVSNPPADVAPMGERPMPSLPQTAAGASDRGPLPARRTRGRSDLRPEPSSVPRWLLSVSRKGWGILHHRRRKGQRTGHSRTDLWASPPPVPQPGVIPPSTRPRLRDTRRNERAPGAKCLQPPVPDGAGPVAIPRVPDPVVSGHACPAACRMRKRRSMTRDLWEVCCYPQPRDSTTHTMPPLMFQGRHLCAACRISTQQPGQPGHPERRAESQTVRGGSARPCPSATPHGPQDARTAYSEGGSSSRPVLERPSACQPRRRSHSVEASRSHAGHRC